MTASYPTPIPGIKPDNFRVLVTGIGGPSGRAATTALQERGFFVLGADMRTVAHKADNFVQVPAAGDTNYPDVLRDLVRDHGIGWLFPTVAEELVVVSEMAQELRANGVAVFISAPAPVRICHDKWLTSQALLSRGVPVPASAIGKHDDPSVISLGFPAVSRPRIGRGGRNVVVHDGPGITPTATEPIWQEFMSGTEYDVLCVRHPEPPNRMMMCQVYEKITMKEGRVGNATDVAAVDMPDIAKLAWNAASTLGLTGPLDMDIRRSHDGTPRILEINARVGAQALKTPALVQLVQEGHRG